LKRGAPAAADSPHGHAFRLPSLRSKPTCPKLADLDRARLTEKGEEHGMLSGAKKLNDVHAIVSPSAVMVRSAIHHCQGEKPPTHRVVKGKVESTFVRIHGQFTHPVRQRPEPMWARPKRVSRRGGSRCRHERNCSLASESLDSVTPCRGARRGAVERRPIRRRALGRHRDAITSELVHTPRPSDGLPREGPF
jgi:hypothetical protein